LIPSGFIRKTLNHLAGNLAELIGFARNRYRMQALQKGRNRSLVDSKWENLLVRVVPKSLEDQAPLPPQPPLDVLFRVNQNQNSVRFTNRFLGGLCLKFFRLHTEALQRAGESSSYLTVLLRVRKKTFNGISMLDPLLF